MLQSYLQDSHEVGIIKDRSKQINTFYQCGIVIEVERFRISQPPNNRIITPRNHKASTPITEIPRCV